jgi:hypothetical protein
MLIILVGLATILLGGTVLAQPRELAGQVHCESTGKGEDSLQLERLCLAQLGTVATRSGADLRLKLENGTSKTFTDERQACEQQNPAKCLEYRLAAYYSVPKLFVIEQLAYESSRVMVVNGRNGSIARMDVHPHLAPGGKRLVMAAAIEAWDVEKEIAVYAVQKDKIELEWSYKAQEYEMWSFVAWEGDDRIKLQVELWTVGRNGERALTKQPAELRRTNAGWSLKKNVKP